MLLRYRSSFATFFSFKLKKKMDTNALKIELENKRFAVLCARCRQIF